MKLIEVGKTYETRDGREVRIYAVDANEVYPIHGAIKVRSGHWNNHAWREDGSFIKREAHDYDIKLKPLRHEGVVEIESDFEGGEIKISVPIEFAGKQFKYILFEETE